MKALLLAVVSLFLVSCSNAPREPGPGFADRDIKTLMARGRVVGLALALIDEGQVVKVAAYGKRSREREMVRPQLPILGAGQFPTLVSRPGAQVAGLAAGLGVVTFQDRSGRGCSRAGITTAPAIWRSASRRAGAAWSCCPTTCAPNASSPTSRAWRWARTTCRGAGNTAGTALRQGPDGFAGAHSCPPDEPGLVGWARP